jgi:hypothetical protein
MPGMLEETKAILRYVAAELGTGTYVNLMAQYRPAGLVGSNNRDGYHEINRQLARDEYERAAQFADELGLTRLDHRSRISAQQLPAHPPRPVANCQAASRRASEPSPPAAAQAGNTSPAHGMAPRRRRQRITGLARTVPPLIAWSAQARVTPVTVSVAGSGWRVSCCWRAGRRGRRCHWVAESNLRTCPDGTLVTPEFVIGAYHQLFQIERSFPMAKSDLQARPVLPPQARLHRGPPHDRPRRAGRQPVDRSKDRLVHPQVRQDNPPLPRRPYPGRRPPDYRRRPANRRPAPSHQSDQRQPLSCALVWPKSGGTCLRVRAVSVLGRTSRSGCPRGD